MPQQLFIKWPEWKVIMEAQWLLTWEPFISFRYGDTALLRVMSISFVCAVDVVSLRIMKTTLAVFVGH
jgi:hypothetical protein